MAGTTLGRVPAMFLTPAAQIGAVVMTLICLFMSLAGGRPQRFIALTGFAAWILSAALQDRSYKHPQYATFVLDGVLMLVWIWAAVKWKQGWLTWVAVFQVLTTATHMAMILDDRIWPKASITAYMIWSYLTLVAFAWGGVQGLLDRRRAAKAISGR